jgi:hypothetical protein
MLSSMREAASDTTMLRKEPVASENRLVREICKIDEMESPQVLDCAIREAKELALVATHAACIRMRHAFLA